MLDYLQPAVRPQPEVREAAIAIGLDAESIAMELKAQVAGRNARELAHLPCKLRQSGGRMYRG